MQAIPYRYFFLWSPCKTHLAFLVGNTAKTDDKDLADAAGNQTVKSVLHGSGSSFPVLPRRHVQGLLNSVQKNFTSSYPTDRAAS